MNLIMISAMYENGGNTTHRFLDGHPNLKVYPFESQVGTRRVADFLTSYVPIRYRWPEFPLLGDPADDYEAFWDEEMKTLLRVPGRSKFRDCGIQMDEAERKASYIAYMSGKERSRRNLVLAYFHSTFDAWTNHNTSGRETHFVGYNPVQVLDAPKFFEDFPEGHMLHVVRNPYSGYADTKKRPFPLGLSQYAWTWNLNQHMALTYKGVYEGHFHVIRFEDLVSDPEGTLTPVFGAMGLDWSEACSFPSFNSERLESVFPWGTIVTASTDANERTAGELSGEEVDKMRALTAVMAAQLQYDGPVGAARVGA